MDCLEHLEDKEHLVNQVMLVLWEVPVIRETWENLGNLDKMVHQALPVTLDLRESQAIPDLTLLRALRERLEKLVITENQGKMELKVKLVLKENQGFLVKMELQEPLEPREH